MLLGEADMKSAVAGSSLLLLAALAVPADAAGQSLAHKARAVLDAHCHRCHGQQGAVEGGMNYVLDRDKLVARKKVVPGKPDLSPLFLKMSSGKMPPPGQQPRPGAADIALVRQWIEAGAPGTQPAAPRPLVTEVALDDLLLDDLDKREPRARRFTRYFSLAPLANAGAGPDELQTYRNALAKLLNSLSWHPRITLPRPVDAGGLLLAIDLRDFQWDANLWNRLLAAYPYGAVHDTAAARAVLVATASRMPCVRLDWFVASACRPPLYYDLLQIPANAAELERQLRVDVTLNIQQERVARCGFNGSGISRNNRVLERHDAQNGAYWRTYDFAAVPENLVDRNLLLPDRRNVFAYPLGPGLTDNTFQHAGGEIIFNLPNGLHGFMLVNANNQRIDKGPIDIVSDPKRPDRAVEPGVSCMACHYRGINPKDDQVRDHVQKNAKAFSRADRDLINALYVPKAKMKALMDEDAERFRAAVEKTGNKITAAEPVLAMTLRYEADVDLPTLAAEAGLRPEELQPRLASSENLARNLGPLKVPGGTVARQVVVQGFVDVIREFRLGTPFQPGVTGPPLPDNTGDADPLEAQSSPANAAAFSPDGRLAAFASADRTVRLYDIEAGRDLRRFIGHTASVWCVAFSPDGTRLLSGGKDGTVRLWEVETGAELRRFEGHGDLVTSVAFSPDGRRALSAGYDHEVILWDLEKGVAVPGFAFSGALRYLNHVAFSPDGKSALVCGGRTVCLLDAATGQVERRFEGHAAAVVSATFSADANQVLSGGDDRTLRLWDRASGKETRVFTGHEGFVKGVAFSPDGKQVLSGATDATVRLWDAATGKELKVFRKHAEPVAAVAFIEQGSQTLSVSRDAEVSVWRLGKVAAVPPRADPPAAVETPRTKGELRPSAVISVGGTIAGMHLSPDRRWLFYLNLTAGAVGKVDAQTARRVKVLRLAEGTETLSLTPGGKTLVATAPAADKQGHSLIQVIDPAKLELRKSFAVPVAVYDAAAGDGGVVFVSGAAGDWTDIAAVDWNKQAVVARWGGVWTRSLLQLSRDQRRLYYSSQGVTPGKLEALVLPVKFDEQPVTYKASLPPQQPLGGDFVLSPDGRFLLCKTGTVVRLTASREGDLQYHGSIKSFLSAVVDPDLAAAFVLTRDGLLEHYSYPDFRLQASYRLPLTPYQTVCDGKEGRLYVAGIDPKSVGDRPRARGHGDIHVYLLKDFPGAGVGARP
jgi:WD40 repeat protein/mono/diheme cytochrome c family protein